MFLITKLQFLFSQYFPRFYVRNYGFHNITCIQGKIFKMPSSDLSGTVKFPVKYTAIHIHPILLKYICIFLLFINYCSVLNYIL
jgi:hypothetical protein